MNKKEQLDIMELITKARTRCNRAATHYKAYKPTLNHEQAYRDVTLAIDALMNAKERIAEVHTDAEKKAQ